MCQANTLTRHVTRALFRRRLHFLSLALIDTQGVILLSVANKFFNGCCCH